MSDRLTFMVEITVDGTREEVADTLADAAYELGAHVDLMNSDMARCEDDEVKEAVSRTATVLSLLQRSMELVAANMTRGQGRRRLDA